jgi:hypothetical protein
VSGLSSILRGKIASDRKSKKRGRGKTHRKQRSFNRIIHQRHECDRVNESCSSQGLPQSFFILGAEEMNEEPKFWPLRTWIRRPCLDRQAPGFLQTADRQSSDLVSPRLFQSGFVLEQGPSRSQLGGGYKNHSGLVFFPVFFFFYCAVLYWAGQKRIDRLTQDQITALLQIMDAEWFPQAGIAMVDCRFQIAAARLLILDC